MKLKVDRHTVEISSPDKVIFPATGYTKLDMARYYEAAAPFMLPHLEDRIVSMQRYPEGIGGFSFFAKEAEEYFPKYIRRVKVKIKSGETRSYPIIKNAAGLVFLAGISNVPVHTWLSRKGRLNNPDLIIWDLDPSDKDFEKVRAGAFILREFFREAGIEPFLKTTGSRGLHIIVPVKPENPFSVVRESARAISAHLAGKHPKLFTVTMLKKDRGKKVFVDYLRNGFAQTAVAPYSLRANDTAGVAMPIEWEELEDKNLNAQSYTLANARDRLKKRGDLWKNIYDNPYPLEAVMSALA